MMRLAPVGYMLFGAAVGFALGWTIKRKRMEGEIEKAVAEVKESLDIQTKLNDDFKDKLEETATKKAYEMIRKVYDNDRSPQENVHKEAPVAKPPMTMEERIMSKPFVIYGDDFGEETEAAETYDTISLTWYADDRLADEGTMELVDIASTIGWDAIDEFDKQHVNTIYIRNDRLKTDYEVFKYDETYEDALKERPHLDKEL